MKAPIYLLFALIIFALPGCGLSTYQVKEGIEMPSSVNDEINNLNIKLFSAIEEGNLAGFRGLLSDSLAQKFRTKSGKDIWKVFSTAAKGRSFDVLNEFYVKSFLPGTKVKLTSGNDINEFEYTFKAPTRESTVSFIVLRDHEFQFLLTAIYGKYGERWRINGIYMDRYSVFDKTAPDYYEQADDLFRNKYRIDALVAITMCQQCHSSDSFFHYTHQHEIDSFNKILVADVKQKYQLPRTLKKIKSEPMVLNVKPWLYRGVLMPCVTYVTSTKLNDSEALKRENGDVQREVDDLFYGFKHNNPCIYYRAYNEMPAANKESAFYDFIELNKK